MIPAVESGHPCSREYIMDRAGGRKIFTVYFCVLLQENHGGAQSVFFRDEIENVYFLTDPHVF